MSTPAPRVDPLVGQLIDGRYHIEARIGEGGMGVVYAGRHRVVGKRLAIKVLRAEMAGDQELFQRFLREAQSASAIGNQHIVDITDFGQMPDRSTYFVMELLDGQPLARAIASSRGPMPVARVCHLGKQIADGLAAAHTAGVVHRDLKPDNIMLVERGADHDFVKILDFGIAKIGASKMTRAGSVFGTPHYMSPEQAMGKPVDHRTDVYALGIILYEMASGQLPFEATNTVGLIMKHATQAPVPLSAAVPRANVPAGLDAIVLRCLAKAPEQRYPTMDALAADLDRLARSLPTSPPVQPGMVISAAPLPSPPRWPLFVIFAVSVVLMTLVAAALVLKLGHRTAAHGTAPAAPPPPGLALQ